MAEKLSVLIFSRNDITQAMGLIRQVYGIADEIVVVDSSDSGENAALRKQTNGMGKVRIVYVVAMGYPDPIFIYAVKKCRHRWILRLDVDERLSGALLSGVRSLLDKNADGFAIKRYEQVRSGTITRFFTWQVRLFKKDRITFRGLLHDQPEVRGRLARVDDSGMYIEHVVELMHHETNRYNLMEKYERYSYRIYNRRVMEYISRLQGSTSSEGRRSGLGSFVNSFLRFYEKAAQKDMEGEVSGLDYLMLRWARNLAYRIKEGNITGIVMALPDALAYLDEMRKWRSASDADENFEIAKRINDEGVIKFLGLDKECTVERINRKYAKDKKGIELMFKLLKDRYRDIKAKSRS